MTTSTQWQLADDAAERYETILVPAILGPFAGALVERADVRPGNVVLDVGCGTGAAARLAASRAGANGRVIGVDVNSGMLAAAGRRPGPEGGAPLEWREADACALPVEDASIDVVVCAQTIQFLPARTDAMREMFRVLVPGGRVALSIWCPLEDNPYFDSLVRAMEKHVGPDTAKGLRAAFGFTDAKRLEAIARDVGFDALASTAVTLELELSPLPDFVPRHVSATPMAAGYLAAPEQARTAVVRDVVAAVAASGARIPFRAHVVTGRRP